jgi:sugar phosphate isomerase/epimerase
MQVLEKYTGRMDIVHVKDSIVRADGAVQLMPLGEGDHNWQPILKACTEAGAKYILTDQENWDRDAFQCTEISLEYLHKLKLL